MKSECLPVRTAHKFATIKRLVKTEIENYETTRRSIIEAHADKDESGKVITTKDGDYTIAQLKPEANIIVGEKLFELSQIEIEIKFIPVAELGDKLVCTPEDLVPLEFIVGE
jgi:hypothetical protein